MLLPVFYICLNITPIFGYLLLEKKLNQWKPGFLFFSRHQHQDEMYIYIDKYEEVTVTIVFPNTKIV